MASTAEATGTDGLEGETPTQRQARLRREKRQKRMADEGEDRLAKIKALNGGVAPPEEVLGGPAAPGPKIASVDDDPDEVDISSLSTTPNQRIARTPDNPLAAAMLQMQQQQRQQQTQGQGQGEGPGGAEDDPMARMMQQMMGLMGGAGGQPQDPNNPDANQQLPQMLQQLMSGAGQAGQQEQAAPTASSTYLWRIVHAIFAFMLAGYIALTSTFDGTALSRSQSVYTDETSFGVGPRLFVIFTSAELVLQSMRYYTEGGRLQGTGMLAMVANSGFIPPPYANYIRIAGRYIKIAQTIFSDAMVVVFVFGCMAWWHDLSSRA